MAEPIYIAKTEADQNTPEFQEAKRQADALGVNIKQVVPADAIVGADKRGDVAAYAEAKKCAQVLGTSVTFADPDGDANNPPAPLSNATHLETESHLYLIPGKCEPQEYRRLTGRARATLKTIVPLTTWDDAPDAVREALKATA